MTDLVTEHPSPTAMHVDALPVGTRLGEFEILALLGVGGFGMVYKAFDHSLHRAVAIKEFMPAALATRGGHVAGQSLEGCYDASAVKLMAAGGAELGAPAQLAEQLAARWP